MKRSPLLLAVLLSIGAPNLCLADRASASDDPVVAASGSDHLTVSEARALIASADAETRRKLANPQALTEFLRNVMLQRAVLREAEAAKWEQRPETRVLLQRSHDLAVGQSFLAAQATIPAGYPGDAEIQAAYDENRARFMQPHGYHLSQVYVPADAATADAARRKLADLKGHLAKGNAGLQEAAKHVPGAQYSDLGWLPEAQLTPAIKTAVSGLPDGGVSEPVCTANGCHLIRLIGTRPAGPAPLSEVRDALVHALRQQKQSQGEQAYANQLMAKQPITVNDAQLTRLGSP